MQEILFHLSILQEKVYSIIKKEKKKKKTEMNLSEKKKGIKQTNKQTNKPYVLYKRE